MTLESITPVILTWNESPNLARCLAPLARFPRVVVLDSFSTDATETIARSYANVSFHQRAFDDHTSQWNHAISMAPTPWILSLDADYVLDPGFVDELLTLPAAPVQSAFFARFAYAVFGRSLSATLYPPRAVLFRREDCSYAPDGHTQLLAVNGPCETLQSRIVHDDRKPLSRWVLSQDKYAQLEALKLSGLPSPTISPQDRLRRSGIFAPMATLIYCLFIKGLILDGWRGWYYTLQRVFAEILLALHLIDQRHSKE